MRYQQSFPTVVPHLRADFLYITHPSATFLSSKLEILVRLACMKHAASVHPEPGSNSPLSEKFMSLVHISMNRSTSLSFCPFHFSQNQQVFIVFSYSIVNVLFFRLRNLKLFFIQLARTSLGSTHHPLSISYVTPFSDIFYPITSISIVNMFFK